jgi:hypothetical protein
VTFEIPPDYERGPSWIKCPHCDRTWRIPNKGFISQENWNYLVDHKLNHEFRARRLLTAHQVAVLLERQKKLLEETESGGD